MQIRPIIMALKIINFGLFYRAMKNTLRLAAASFGLSLGTPAHAGASSFAVVNAVGVDMSGLAIRRVGGGQWQSLGITARAGRAAPVKFSDPDCAFDLRATLAGGEMVTWSGVNLCDVKLVTLRRSEAGIAWVDYD